MRSWTTGEEGCSVAPSESGRRRAQQVAARALDAAHRVEAAGVADRDRVGRPGGGEGHPRADLEDRAVAAVEEAGVAVVLRLEGLGQQPVEDAQIFGVQGRGRRRCRSSARLSTPVTATSDGFLWPSSSRASWVVEGRARLRKRRISVMERLYQGWVGCASLASVSVSVPVPVSAPDLLPQLVSEAMVWCDR